MYNKFKLILSKNDFYRGRKNISDSKIEVLQEELSESLREYPISIFVVGSIGRGEVGEKSDLDLFIVSKEKISQLKQYEIYSKLIKINSKLKFPPFSNDGQFLKIHNLNDLKNLTGLPNDDSLNLFTTRMLMILESKVLFNHKLYNEILDDIIEHYLRDRKSVNDFKPLFLLNDILRFWRTLCLNYEAIRHDTKRPWRKKNINLKYSRLLTVFSTVMAIIVKKEIDHNDILEICSKTPLERLTWSLDKISDDKFISDYNKILEYYKIFLEAKENTDIEENLTKKEELNKNAEEFSIIFFNILNSKKIDSKLKKYLVL